MGSGPISSASAYTALADAITKTFSRHDAGQGIEPHPDPRLATSGEQPPMTFPNHQEQERRNENGVDRHFIHQLRRVVGRVRFGWSVTATLLSPLFLLAALLVHNGWITTPAKDSDMKAMQVKFSGLETTILTQAETTRALAVTIARIEEGQKAVFRVLDKIDSKLDRIEDQHLAIMRAFVTTIEPQQKTESQKATPAPASPVPAPPSRSRAKVHKKQETGLFLFR